MLTEKLIKEEIIKSLTENEATKKYSVARDDLLEREDFDIVIKVSKKGRERTRIIDREGVLSNVYYSIKKALENGIGNEFETETLPNSYIGLATADWCQVVSQIVENKNGYALRVVVMKWRSGAAKRPHSAGVTERSFSKPAEIIKKYWGQK